MTAPKGMKWRRVGKIFDPLDFELASGCESFAQSPQALVLDDRVRIYFSSRRPDSNGKFLSHVCYVDMARDLGAIIGVNEAPVIALGKLGCFDQHGIFPMNVLRHDGRILGYTSGWTRRVSVSVDTGIGLAISDDDGMTFQRIGDGPILSASLYEPFLVGDPFVAVVDGVYHMWYIFGTRWERFKDERAPDRVYKIGHATSSDGVNWCKEEGRQIVGDALHENESQALPTVFRVDEFHHMLFCFRESSDFRTGKGRGYRIGHAYSSDLVNWTRSDELAGLPLGAEGWDSEMMCYPHVFELEGRFHLLYNGNEFGKRGFGLAVLE